MTMTNFPKPEDYEAANANPGYSNATDGEKFRLAQAAMLTRVYEVDPNSAGVRR